MPIDHITASPLHWPEGWARSETQERSRFGKWNDPVTINKATRFVLDELSRMGVFQSDVIVSTNLKLRIDGLPYSNQKQPEDKGVSVWWIKDGKQMVLALDKYDRIADNIYAVGKTIEAMRGIERWGSGEILQRTFTGFQALPDPESASKPSWQQVLNYYGDSLSEAKTAYLKARKAAHPDHGGSTEEFKAVEEAWEQAQQICQ